MKIIIIVFLFSQALYAQKIQNGAYIITHPSRHYQTNQKLITETNEYLRAFNHDKAQIIGLFQKSVKIDPLWYAKPVSFFTELYYSHAGEHQLSFPLNALESYTIHLSGGYLSACLGRTASYLINDFLRPEIKSKSLRLVFYAKTVFTGFLENGGQLKPRTPYLESILDDSIDGLSFARAIKLIHPSDYKDFLLESMNIALLQKAPLANREGFTDFNLVIEYQNNKFSLVKSNIKHSKKIIVSFR